MDYFFFLFLLVYFVGCDAVVGSETLKKSNIFSLSLAFREDLKICALLDHAANCDQAFGLIRNNSVNVHTQCLVHGRHQPFLQIFYRFEASPCKSHLVKQLIDRKRLEELFVFLIQLMSLFLIKRKDIFILRIWSCLRLWYCLRLSFRFQFSHCFLITLPQLFLLSAYVGCLAVDSFPGFAAIVAVGGDFAV